VKKTEHFFYIKFQFEIKKIIHIHIMSIIGVEYCFVSANVFNAAKRALNILTCIAYCRALFHCLIISIKCCSIFKRCLLGTQINIVP
jgi:hypothetical protein